MLEVALCGPQHRRVCFFIIVFGTIPKRQIVNFVVTWFQRLIPLNANTKAKSYRLYQWRSSNSGWQMVLTLVRRLCSLSRVIAYVFPLAMNKFLQKYFCHSTFWVRRYSCRVDQHDRRLFTINTHLVAFFYFKVSTFRAKRLSSFYPRPNLSWQFFFTVYILQCKDYIAEAPCKSSPGISLSFFLFFWYYQVLCVS